MNRLYQTFAFLLTVCLVDLATAIAEPKDYLKKPDAWFATEEASQIASCILTYQSDLGGWPKNEDTTEKPFPGDRTKLKATYDNGATTDELRFLARVYNASKKEDYKSAFDRGLDYVLKGQYPNGGWPQLSPPGKGYHRHITFNDNAMVRLLTFVRDVSRDPTFDFVAPDQREACAKSFDLGIDCILKCQIRKDGKLTVWCAQHDELDFRPRPARTFELATFSGSESVGVTRLLMSIENPSDEIVQAVEAAVAWLEKAKLNGIRVEEQPDSNAPKGKNKVVIQDPTAPPLWARFYDLETAQPVFAARDGVPKATLAEIGYERGNGYTWYGNWPQKLLESEYPKWKTKLEKGNRK